MLMDENRIGFVIADILSAVKKDVDTYANGAEQFDDITMVCFKMGEAN